MYYIFDIDGTLADSSHRIHHITKTPKDWDSFFQDDLILLDEPIKPVVSILRAILKDRATDPMAPGIVFLTGRPEKTRVVTIKWLQAILGLRYDHAIPFSNLIMRPNGNFMNDDIWKVQELSKLEKERIICVFEDRNRIVKAMRAAGYTVMHVADGDF